MKVIIGAGKTAYEGWLSTQENERNLLDRAGFERSFQIGENKYADKNR